MPGFLASNHGSHKRETMTQSQSISRPQAEYAANLAQAEFFAKDHAIDEQQFVRQAREAKTIRLRDARMAKELKDRTSALTGLIGLRARKA
jgi:hypothetical protein